MNQSAYDRLAEDVNRNRNLAADSRMRAAQILAIAIAHAADRIAEAIEERKP